MPGGFRNGRYWPAFSPYAAPPDPAAKQVAKTIRRHSHAAWSRPIRSAKTVAEAARLLPAVLDDLEQQIAQSGVTGDPDFDTALFETAFRRHGPPEFQRPRLTKEQEDANREFVRLANRLAREDRED